MRMPHLELIYRIAADMAPASHNTAIRDVHGTGVTRLVLPITGGTVRGPRVNGVIVPGSGADWAQSISRGGAKVS